MGRLNEIGSRQAKSSFPAGHCIELPRSRHSLERPLALAFKLDSGACDYTFAIQGRREQRGFGAGKREL